MRIAILAGGDSRNELIKKGFPPVSTILWHTSVESLVNENADLYMDLLFTNEPERVIALSALLPKPIIVNAVVHTLAGIGQPFIRINAWPGFLNRSSAEIAVADAGAAIQVMQGLGWDYKIVPDQPGMITPRVVAMLINEAYFALGEGISTKEEIDTAMKLGTNYPHGPFKWAEIIGLENVRDLLSKLSEHDERYLSAKALTAAK